jgi:ribosomal protein L32
MGLTPHTLNVPRASPILNSLMEEKKPAGFLQKLKQRAADKRRYGHELETDLKAGTDVKVCPNCGAGRAPNDSHTHCAYCGIERDQRAADLQL